MIMMFVILGLAFLNMFSIGLASHTRSFDIHYRQIVSSVCILIALLGIIAGGVCLVVLSDYNKLRVNPESLWDTPPLSTIPPLPSTTAYNEEEWYKLTSAFQIKENCDSVPNPQENCNALDYTLKIQGTSGSLRVNVSPEKVSAEAYPQANGGAAATTFEFTGQMEDINSLLAGTEFSP